MRVALPVSGCDTVVVVIFTRLQPIFLLDFIVPFLLSRVRCGET